MARSRPLASRLGLAMYALAALAFAAFLSGLGDRSEGGGARARAAGPAAPAAPRACDRWAAPRGSDRWAGTLRRPFATAQRLVDALRPGQTGCLRSGVYDETTASVVARFRRAGFPGRPITLRSAPGGRATLRGVVYVPNGSDHVRIGYLDLDVRNPDHRSGLAIYATDTVVFGNRITNRRDAQCIMLGNHEGGGRALRTVIRDNFIHDCGDPAHGNKEHAIYFGNSVGARVVGNVVRGVAAWAMHLYPDAKDSLIAENVIFDTGSGGVTISGGDEGTSDGNVIERNLIVRSAGRNVASHWDAEVGRDNTVRRNCVWGGRYADIAEPVGFVVADNILRDPGFLDVDANDFRLRSGSPCDGLARYGVAAALARATPPS